MKINITSIRKTLLHAAFASFVLAVHCSSSGGGDSASPATPAATYTITYNENGSTGGLAPSNNNNYTSGATVPVASQGSLVKAGSSFVGWNTQANGLGTTYAANTTFVMGSANVTLFARWTTATTYQVTYNGNGAIGGTIPTDANKYLANDTVTAVGPGTMIRTNFSFGGWNTASNGSGTDYATNATFIITNNITLYAKWNALPRYSVTYNGNGHTGGAPPVDAGTYATGVNLVILNNTGNMTLAGFGFNGWNTLADGSGTSYASNSLYTMGAANITFYAKWEAVNCQQTAVNPVTGISNLGGFCTTPVVVDNGNGTLTDTANNLLWVKCTVKKDGSDVASVVETSIGNCNLANAASVQYEVPGNQAASITCNNLVYAGRSDWVLPDLKQLRTYYRTGGGSAPFTLDSDLIGFGMYNSPSQLYFITSTVGTGSTVGVVDFSESEGNGGGPKLRTNADPGIVTCVVKL